METASFFGRAAAALLARRGLVTLVMVALLGVSAAALPFLRQASLHVFRDETHPKRLDMDTIDQHFVNDDFVIIAMKTDDGFSHKALRASRELDERLLGLKATTASGEEVNIVADVLSLTTVKDAYGGELSFRSAPLVPDPVPEAKEDLLAIRERALNNPVIAKNLVGRHGKVISSIARIDPAFSDGDYTRVVERLRQSLRDAEEAEAKGYELFATGHPVSEADFPTYTLRDVLRFNPVMVVIALLLTWVFTRRWLSVFVIFNVVGMCQLLAYGSVPLTGTTFNPLNGMIPPIAVTLCAATMFHFFSESAKHAKLDPATAALRTFRDLLKPVLIATVTTAIGFASLTASSVQAIRDFGIAASITVVSTVVVTVCSIALLYSWKTPDAFISIDKAVSLSPRAGQLLEGLGRLVLRRRLLVSLLGLGLVTLLGYGASRIFVQENALTYYPEDSQLRRGAAVVEDNIAGTELFVVSLKAPQEGAFTEPEVLAKVESLITFMEKELGIDTAISVVDYLKIMHRAFFEEAADQYRLPETRAQAAQLLLINSDDRLREYLDETRSWARIVVRTRTHNTDELRALYDRLDERLAETFPAAEGYQTTATGISRLFTITASQVSTTQVLSLSIACAIIFLMVLLFFRSPSAAAVSLLPNALPLLTALGVMGFGRIPLSVGTAMVCSIALGIAVDDTVHFLQHTRRRLDEGDDVDAALLDTFRVKGPAIVWTSLVFTLGFAVFALAEFVPVGQFGVLVALSMASALVGDLLLLPALIALLRLRLGVSRTRQNGDGV